MTTHQNSETLPPASESASGQTTEPDMGEYSTLTPDSQLLTLQHHIGPIRLKARVPGACIALQLVPPAAACLLTVEEALRLAIALVDLIEDIEADGRARDHSRQKLAAIIAAADASAESYHSKL